MWLKSRPMRARALITALATVGVAFAVLAVVPAAGSATARSARAGTITINSARAEGRTKSALVNVTYRCSGFTGGNIDADLKFGWGEANGAAANATCDGANHTLDIKASSNHTVIKRGDKATATVDLHNHDGDGEGDIEATASKKVTLG